MKGSVTCCTTKLIYNLHQVAFASEGIKDAQQIAANKEELKGMMKTVRIEDIDVCSILLVTRLLMFQDFQQHATRDDGAHGSTANSRDSQVLTCSVTGREFGVGP